MNALRLGLVVSSVAVLMCFAHVYIPSQNHKGCEKCHVQWRQVLHILLIKEFMEEKK
jgi:hypothetical protein